MAQKLTVLGLKFQLPCTKGFSTIDENPQGEARGVGKNLPASLFTVNTHYDTRADIQ